MSIRRLSFYLLFAFTAVVLAGVPIKLQFMGTQQTLEPIIAGRNVNMVAGTQLPDGDPYLQRQNEPSGAVSTRNPLHLLFGCNDSRWVDMPISEGPLPGPPMRVATGDAWLGVFKSYNGGESWISGPLPGHPYDKTPPNSTSPLYGLGVASDPTVRAGANGLFYYSGIAFDRTTHGRSVIFVARFIDNNVTKLGDVDPIKYLDATIIDQGTSGQFADKPWIAVDSPRSGSGTVPIYAPDTPVQNVARHNVYMAYSIFLGSLSGGDQSKIMFARSTNCGTTWEGPTKVSESQHINQGTTIAVSPKDGTIYLAWRRFPSSSEPSTIMVSRSTNFGLSFTKAVEVAPSINAFDQYTAENSFRTYAFPTLAVDRDGIVYVAWSERAGPEGDARIVISTSTNGSDWSPPIPINNHGGRGHQIMPSLTYAAGRLTMTWYDTRNSEGGYGNDISDPGSTGKRHTIDVWVAQAIPSLTPTFMDFTQVSKYLYWVETSDGKVPDNPAIIRKENNSPNFPLFDGGHKPFFGDYIDIASAPTFLFDVNLETQVGAWRFNTKDTDPATSFISWADNRDVRPPSDGDWTQYNPPNVPSSTTPCTDGTRTGMRNQNIYCSHITQGLLIGAPVNTKPLEFPDPNKPQKRTFLVFARNLTENLKRVRLNIETPPGMQASFWESWPIEKEDCPFVECKDTEVTVEISPYSSITLTVFVQPYEANPYATFRVRVEEVDGQGDFLDYIVLNPDPENTRVIPVSEEYHTPTMMVEPPADVNLTDPTMLSQGIVYTPNSEILNFVNPDVVTPVYRNPVYRNSNVVNPAISSAVVGDWPNGNVTDIQWRITNNNNTTSAYSFVPIGDPPALPEGAGAYQLLIYRISTTPTSGALVNNCALFEDEHHELLLKIENPVYRNPVYRNPVYRNPVYRNNTFCLAPGETAVCTLRIVEQNPSSGSSETVQSSSTLKTTATSNGFNVSDYAKTVAAAAVAQAANPDGQISFASSLYIIKQVLPDAWVNDQYPQTSLEAFGGTPTSIDDHGTPDDPSDDIWKYDGQWTAIDLVYPSSGKPSGLSLDANGNIWGTPAYDSELTYPQVISFIAQVTDASTPAQTAQREFTITVGCDFHTITPIAGPNGSIIPSSAVKVPHGLDQTFEIKPDYCFHVLDVIVDKDTSGAIDLGPLTTYTFENVRADHTLDATFEINTYTITPTADPPQGGIINPSTLVPVFCGENKTFTISPNEGYLLKDVIVDGASQGPVTEYTFYGVVANHTITAKFQKLESWVKRYNNADINGDDEAKAIAVSSSGNVYVTGYSTGRTTGPDFYTIRYNGEGVQGWSARYDGPAHLGDYATAVAVDNSGNAFVTGYGYRGNVVKHADYATLKYNNSGSLVWDAQYDDRRNGNDEVRAITIDSSGFIYITGRSEDSLSKNAPKHYDYYTIKYDPNTGKVVWAQRYDSGLVENAVDEATAIAVDASGNVYVTGRSQGSGTGFDYATIKYNSGGIQQWVKRYNNGNGIDEAAAIVLDAAGNVYVTGRSQGATGFDYATIKYDSSGNLLRVHRYDNSNLADEASAIAVDASGNVYVTGRSQGSGTGFDYATVKYDSGGKQLWVQRYDYASGNDEAAAIALDTTGNIYVTGRSQGSGTGFDYATIKYDTSGKMVWRARYNNEDINGADEAAAIAVDANGNIYVTGRSQGATTGLDYATVKYKQQ
jgi:uncharacterized delta-60 repeat protein